MKYSPDDFDLAYGKPRSWKRFWTIGIPIAVVVGGAVGLIWKMLTG